MAFSRLRRLLRPARRLFRWTRICFWLVLLAGISGSLWLHLRGLPEPVKARLQAELRARGINLRYDRMRLRWYRGIVAEGIEFGAVGPVVGPHFQAKEATLRLNFSALLHWRFELSGLGLQDGTLTWPARSADQTVTEVSLTNLRAEMAFLPDDQWDIRWAHARFLEARLALNGRITNASALLTRPTPVGTTPSAALEPFWLELIQENKLSPGSSLSATFGGDARAPGSFLADVKVQTPDLSGPWGRGHSLSLSAHLHPPARQLREVSFDLAGERILTRWGQADSLQASWVAHVASNGVVWTSLSLKAANPGSARGKARSLALSSSLRSPAGTWPPEAVGLEVEVRHLQTSWGEAEQLRCTADLKADPTVPQQMKIHYQGTISGGRSSGWEGALSASDAAWIGTALVLSSNFWPSTIETQITTTNLATAWGRATQANFHAGIRLPSREVLMGAGNTNQPWTWTLQQLGGDLQADLRGVESVGHLAASRLIFDGSWEKSRLELRQLHGELYGGECDVRGHWDALSRLARFHLESGFDWHGLSQILPTNARPWLARCQWNRPPRIDMDGLVVLPALTDHHPDWVGGVAPTLTAWGRADLGPARFRDFNLSSLRLPFALTNYQLTAPDIVLSRPEGRLTASVHFDYWTHQLYAQVSSGLDPRPLILAVTDTNVGEALKLVDLQTPPGIALTIRADPRDWKQIGVQGLVNLTNAAFRGEAIRELHTTLSYTNEVLAFYQPHLIRAEGEAAGGSVSLDFRRGVVCLTNLAGNIEPMAICRAVGPHVERQMKPYRFSQPPTARAEGVIGLRAGDRLDDIWFDVAGPGFEWRDFQFETAAGRVHWLGQFVFITNFLARCHGGDLSGSLLVDDRPVQGQTFSFNLLATNVDLGPFLKDVSTRTNHIEGHLSGRLIVTEANTWSLGSWQGYGDLHLRDGLIWQAPLFSYLSPILNKISPGLGSSRAREADGSFFITNSVILSTNLVVHTSGARLRLTGTVDFDQNLNGRVEAGLFRDTPGVGWLLSAVLWPVTKVFEYKFTGPLEHPKFEPVYIPKFLFIPFKPFQTLRDITRPEDVRGTPQFRK